MLTAVPVKQTFLNYSFPRHLLPFTLLVGLVFWCILEFSTIQLVSFSKANTSEINQYWTGNTLRREDEINEESQEEKSYELQLKVPFYCYENGLDWTNATSSIWRLENRVGKWDPNPQRTEGNHTFVRESFLAHWKHSDDWWFLMHAKRHPMRTRDPTKAKLFFVPTLLNALATKMKRSNLCLDGRCNLELLEHVHQILTESPYYQRHHGRDHIVVDSHWKRLLEPHHALFNCSFVGFEGSRFEDELVKNGARIQFPATYVGQACSPWENVHKTDDFALITSWSRGKCFIVRQRICNWLNNGNNTNIKTHYSVSGCGPGPQCPALAQAKYGFHAPGDTLGANRLMDTLLSDTVPIFTNAMQYDILPDFIPWRNMSHLVPMTWKVPDDTITRQRFYNDIERILNESDSEYQQKRQIIADYRHLLDVRQPYQFDMYMHNFALKLGNFEEQ